MFGLVWVNMWRVPFSLYILLIYKKPFICGLRVVWLCICYGMPFCVTHGADKIIFGNGTKLIIEIGKLIAFIFWFTLVVPVSVLTIRRQQFVTNKFHVNFKNPFPGEFLLIKAKKFKLYVSFAQCKSNQDNIYLLSVLES